MKKVYIPTEKELSQLESAKANMYQYLVAKLIETLIMEDVLYESIDMFDEVYENWHEFPEILPILARLYPNRMKENERAVKDIQLWRALTEKLPVQDKSIYFLDSLSLYCKDFYDMDTGMIKDATSGKLPFDRQLITNVAKLLADKLSSCPQYRFEYSKDEPCPLLHSIFNCEITSPYVEPKSYEDFTTIDPIYSVKLCQDGMTRNAAEQAIRFGIGRSMIRYAARYGLDGYNNPYEGHNVISKPDAKVRKLIRRLQEHKENY